MAVKYVVIHEITETGFMDCVGIYDDEMAAYGKAYTTLNDEAFNLTGNYDDKYYISTLAPREGDSGYVMALIEKATDYVMDNVTVLFYEPENEKGEAKT